MGGVNCPPIWVHLGWREGRISGDQHTGSASLVKMCLVPHTSGQLSVYLLI